MLKKFFISSSFLLLLTGCAIQNTTADFSYTPSFSKSKLSIAKNLSLKIEDERKLEDVGYIMNGLGMKTARILPEKKVASILYDSFKKALLTKDIVIAEGDHTLLVTINRCFSDYNPTFFYQRMVANLSLTLNMLNKEGESIYFKKIETKGVESPVFVSSGKNAAKALTKALSQAMEELLKDELFLKTFS